MAYIDIAYPIFKQATLLNLYDPLKMLLFV